ncbi:YjbF family lipoprotein [Aliidiomarina halalkaliphila]|uniref:YjbF family lipoprotein n=1 Tax=Aliidiomarina halalkaliphila TaxID=2593535 RepID=A0A552X584_9GAMM|nr:YjbF family lipoprotein [Aliidiomarina halalkaliphila]TRW50182.1 YjbF family lipoprotein [Aliidiomarina halalkaliphila]
MIHLLGSVCFRRGLRSLLLVALAALVFTGCSGVHQDIRETARYIFATGDDFSLTPEQISAFPYTGVYLRRGNGPQNFVVLGFIDDYEQAEGAVAQYHWVSNDNVTLVTEAGRLVRTQGLSDEHNQKLIGRVDLRATSNRSADPLRCLVTAPQHCPTSYTRDIDMWRNNHAQSTRVTSRFEIQPNVTIELPTRTVSTTHIIERGVFERTGERFVNEFWAENDGHIVKSKQYVMPGETPFQMTQVKWVGRDD